VKLEKVSVSQIAAFDPTQSAGCPRRWWFRYVDGRKEPETAAKARGTDFHKEIEHYLLTGEDVLRPEVRVGKHLIDRGVSQIVEAQIPGGDLIHLGLTFPWNDGAAWPVRESTLLTGRVDRIDFGGTHLDGEGNPIDDGFPEILDWKTTSSITAYAKSGAQLATDPQMIGYASALLRPDDPDELQPVSQAQFVRLSHVYFQTKGVRAAAKRTIVVSRDHVFQGYHRLCGVVDDMRKVASLPVVDDVPKNLSACSAYGGCPHAAYCPKTSAEALRGIWSKTDMSLLNHMRKPTPSATPAAQQIAPPATPAHVPQTPAPAAAPAPTAQDRAALLRAELAKLEQESESAADDDATCEACGEDLTIHNLSRLPDGTIRHIGCKSAPAPITPPDQPPIVQRFEPVPAESIATLPPAARAAAEAAPPPAPVEKRRPGRPRKAPAPAAQAAEHTAPAVVPSETAAYSEEIKTSGLGVSVPEAVEQFREAWPEVKKAAAPESSEARQLRENLEASDVSEAREAFRQTLCREQIEARAFGPFNILLLDCCLELPGANGRPDVFDLGPELDGYAQSLAQKHNAAELRCAPSDGPLAYGKWQGALTAVLRECFKVPATHRVFTLRTRGDAVRELAAAAIAHKFDLVVWGGS